MSGNVLHEFNILPKFNTFHKGNTYYVNFILHNTLYTMVLSYLQGERISEFYYLLWQCLDNTLKLEISIFNPHICMGIYSTKLTHTVIYRGNTYPYFIVYHRRHEYHRLLGCFSHFGLEYGQPWNMGKILIKIYSSKKNIYKYNYFVFFTLIY